MALSDAINKPAAAAPAGGAPNTPNPPSTGGKTASKGSTKAEVFRNTGAANRAKLSEEARNLEGSKSDKVAFISTLGDPSRAQKRRSEGKDLPSHQVVGYALKILEDMDVPNAPLKQGFKSPTDCEPLTWVPAKAGETVYLNNLEVGALIAQPQFAGTFTGEGTVVKFSVKFSNDRPDPLPILMKDGEGSIKEQMILIAESTEVNGVKTWKPKEGFEKFAALYVRKSAGGRGSANRSKKNEVQKDLAAAFLAYLNEKG